MVMQATCLNGAFERSLGDIACITEGFRLSRRRSGGVNAATTFVLPVTSDTAATSSSTGHVVCTRGEHMMAMENILKMGRRRLKALDPAHV